MRVLTSPLLAVAPVVADAVSVELRLVVLAAPVVPLALAVSVEVDEEGVVDVEATEPLPLTEPDAPSEPVVEVVELSRAVSLATLEPVPVRPVEPVEPLVESVELREPEVLVLPVVELGEVDEELGLVEEALPLGVVEELAMLESVERVTSLELVLAVEPVVLLERLGEVEDDEALGLLLLARVSEELAEPVDPLVVLLAVGEEAELLLLGVELA